MAYDIEARANWHRYLHLKDRGHLEYMAQARRNEGMYLGGGEQWSDEDKAILREQRRPFYEFNEIMPSVNSALGHQIQHRLDISFKPRGGSGDLLKATALSKVVMQIADMNRLHWKETQVYGDGLIQQRGYYDVRLSFDNNILGEVVIDTLDSLDVIPDDGAKSYDPDGWNDVTITRHLTLDEIEQRYGKKARARAEASGDDGPDWGEDDDEVERNKFGGNRMFGAADAYFGDGTETRRYRVIDRQFWVYEKTRCLVYPDSGDVVMADRMRPEDVVAARMQGALEQRVMKRRVKWWVSTYCATLFADYSPYDHFTVVPYFAYFRRGKTRGLVDNGIGPQEALNKAVSQYIHIVNTAANSGWITEEDSITNMDPGELEAKGAMTGLHLEYKKGSQPPQKIQPNQIPSGVDRLIDRATQALKDVTVPDAMRGLQGNAVSGVAKQADQFASQQQMAVPLDNLTYTRHMLGNRIMKLVQRFYDSYRVFKITETDHRSGRMVEKVLEVNKFDPASGSYLNDLTVGTYDVVISEQPMSVTFENSQFEQALAMKEKGIAIPDATVVRYSSLADKEDILQNMQQADPRAEAEAELNKAKANLTNAQAAHVRAQTTSVDVESIYSAVNTAQLIAMNPMVSPLADSVLGSAGYEDKNAAPLVPTPAPGMQALPPPANTNPLTPANPGVGIQEGIESPTVV